MKIIDYYSPSFDNFFRKIKALSTYFVTETNKMEQSKTSGARSSGIYQGRWQIYESLLFLADFVTPGNIQSNLEICQQSNSEKKTQIKAVSNKTKLTKSGGTNQNCQADLLIQSSVEVLNALKQKANQSHQRRSEEFKFGDLTGSELEQIQPGPIKKMLKLDMQKLIYQTKYSNLQIVSSSQTYQNFGIVRSFDSCDVTFSEYCTPMSSNRGSKQRSFTIDSN